MATGPLYDRPTDVRGIPMFAHVRANLCLLALTLLLCCVLYPLALWGAGRAFFATQAEGSLIDGPNGKSVGSRLIAQAFTGDEWFQPRPSAASYNAAASGAGPWTRPGGSPPATAWSTRALGRRSSKRRRPAARARRR